MPSLVEATVDALDRAIVQAWAECDGDPTLSSTMQWLRENRPELFAQGINVERVRRWIARSDSEATNV